MNWDISDDVFKNMVWSERCRSESRLQHFRERPFSSVQVRAPVAASITNRETRFLDKQRPLSAALSRYVSDDLSSPYAAKARSYSMYRVTKTTMHPTWVQGRRGSAIRAQSALDWARSPTGMSQCRSPIRELDDEGTRMSAQRFRRSSADYGACIEQPMMHKWRDPRFRFAIVKTDVTKGC